MKHGDASALAVFCRAAAAQRARACRQRRAQHGGAIGCDAPAASTRRCARRAGPGAAAQRVAVDGRSANAARLGLLLVLLQDLAVDLLALVAQVLNACAPGRAAAASARRRAAHWERVGARGARAHSDAWPQRDGRAARSSGIVAVACGRGRRAREASAAARGACVRGRVPLVHPPGRRRSGRSCPAAPRRRRQAATARPGARRRDAAAWRAAGGARILSRGP